MAAAGYWFNQQSQPTTKEDTPRIVSADIYNNKNKSGEFLGEKGENIIYANNKLEISTNGFETNQVRFFNTEIEGKKIYFMVVKDDKGKYRAAANACEVCFGAHKGFKQVIDKIVCNNCGNAFPLNTLGVTKGGCNPGPISADVKTTNNQLIISLNEINQVSNLF